MKWPFGKKKEQLPKEKAVRRFALAEQWQVIQLKEPDRRDAASSLAELATRLERETPAAIEELKAAGRSGTIADVDFLFDVLKRLPRPVKTSSLLPGTDGFSWEVAESDLGEVARVTSAIRIAEQKRLRDERTKDIAVLERRFLALTRQTTSEPTGSRHRQKLLNELEEARRELADAQAEEVNELHSLDHEYETHLRRLLRLHELHAAALTALASVESGEGSRAIVEALHSNDPAERAFAARALQARNWQPETVRQHLELLLIQARTSDTEAEREQALSNIRGLITASSSADELISEFEPAIAAEGLTDLQAAVLDRLISLHSENALSRLQQVLESSLEPPDLKARVCASLPDIGSNRALALLVQAMDDPETEVRVAAARALGRIPPGVEGELRRQAMERLVFALRDGDVGVRQVAAESLRRYPEATGLLARTIHEERNPNAREYAAIALSQDFSPDDEATAALVSALTDEVSAVRRAAADALANQGQIPDRPDQWLLFLAAREDWAELRRIGAQAAPALVRLVADQDARIRLAVVELLGRIKAGDGVRELCIALSDSNQDVRAAAANALRLIEDPAALPALKAALPKEGFKHVRLEMERAIRRLEG
ncbi:MAG: HEAT repeat domain-containing protein [candidate division WOR-3 bacterium]